MHFALNRRSFLASLLAVGLGHRNLLKPLAAHALGQSVQPVKIDPLSDFNRVRVNFNEKRQFGIACPRLPYPRIQDRVKLLTGSDQGHTNNTVVRVGGVDYFYGWENTGFGWVKDHDKILKAVTIPGKDKERSWMSVWEVNNAYIRVTQFVEMIPGEQTRLYDTVLVKYHIANHDKVPHPVGLRILLDTFIGTEDGLPFYIPPTESKPGYFVQTMDTIPAKNLPSFIQVLETTDLRDQNAVLAVLNLKVHGAESVEKVVICRWPQLAAPGWGGTGAAIDWAYQPMGELDNTRNSCVLLYWPEVSLKPGENRELAFTYGLGRVLSDLPINSTVTAGPGGKLRLFISPGVAADKPFVVAAYVKDRARTKVLLKLPDGCTIREGTGIEKASSQVTRAGYGQASWLVTAAKPGSYVIEAELPGHTPQEIAREVVEVHATSRFE